MVDDDDIGIDPDVIDEEEEAAFEAGVFDAEKVDAAQESGELGWGATIQDWVTQANLGLAKVFTWPLDVLKVIAIGEGLSGMDEFESALAKEGKTFDRDAYMKGLLESTGYIPTQEMAEEFLQNNFGIQTKPRTAGGKAIKQVASVAGFTPGGVAKKLTSGLTAGLTTSALKTAGAHEGVSEVVGDIASALPASTRNIPRQLSQAKQQLSNTAERYSLPFMEYMARENVPFVRGRITRRAEANLKREFDLSLNEAVDRVITDNNFAKRMRDNGVNLEVVAEQAYDDARILAANNPAPIPMDNVVSAINRRIAAVRARAPSPSTAERAAINILENERDILSVATPTAEQLIDQHMNYNSNVKGIYRKPEFSGSEQEVRDAYRFINDELVNAMQNHGSSEAATSFRGANELYHEIMNLQQVDNLIGRTLKEGFIDPKGLTKLLSSKNGNFIRRALGNNGVHDLTEIARYGQTAQTNMSHFIDLQSPYVRSDLQAYGELAPFIFSFKGMGRVAGNVTRTLSKRIQGRILTNPAARHEYRILLRDAANQQYQLLKKDFFNLDQAIIKEYGSVDDFVSDTMADIADFDEED